MEKKIFNIQVTKREIYTTVVEVEAHTEHVALLKAQKQAEDYVLEFSDADYDETEFEVNLY